MPAYYQLRRSAALWIVLAAGGELALDSQFQTASVSERLSMIREKVTALVPGGGYAEYAVAHETNALPAPSGLTLVEAERLPIDSTSMLGRSAG